MNILWHITCLLLLRSCAPGFFIHGIVGGKESVPHSRPYMVYIRDKITKHACSGVLIREDYVMTAGHCIGGEANVTLLDFENCGRADTLCNEGPPGQAQVDSGGPLVCEGVARGVVSFITNTENADYLTGYTNISHYLSWIHHIMSPHVSVPHSRPYKVYIRDKVSKVACGGFLVREDFVMTAAHCKQSHLVVYLGVDDTNLLPDGVEVDPYPHPNFTMKEKGHDIMLLKLKTPVILNKNVSTITLPKTKNEEISKDCMVIGWGWKKYVHESPSNVLKEANVTLLDSKNCGRADTLCNKGPPGPAQGDSGGPLVCGGVARGIVSFSKNMGNVDQLKVYTHTSRFLPWIHDIMSPVIPNMLAQKKVFCLAPKTQ